MSLDQAGDSGDADEWSGAGCLVKAELKGGHALLQVLYQFIPHPVSILARVDDKGIIGALAPAILFAASKKHQVEIELVD